MKSQGKRLVITYVVILLWIIMGLFAINYQSNINSLSVYFLSLTGFVGSYIYSESIRNSKSSGIFFKGRSSRREILVYICVIIWFVLGIWGMLKESDLTQLAAYYAALTPFVAAAILGETFKKEPIEIDSSEENIEQN